MQRPSEVIMASINTARQKKNGQETIINNLTNQLTLQETNQEFNRTRGCQG